MADRDYRSLDALFHSRIRLAAVSALVRGKTMDFGELKRITGATEGNLSTHLRKLEDAGYITVDKTFQDRRPRTVYALTEAGRKAFADYVRVLEGFLEPQPSEDGKKEG